MRQEDLVLLVWLQPTRKIGVCCCSGAIHVLQLRTSINVLVDEQI